MPVTRDERIEAFLGCSEPWPVWGVLLDLAKAAEHLLRDHGCDVHGWEAHTSCAKRARELVARLHGSAVRPCRECRHRDIPSWGDPCSGCSGLHFDDGRAVEDRWTCR